MVVVGHGMVGARFAEEVRRHDPEGGRVRLTILAAEPRPAYNRVLLPSLLSGVLREEDFAATTVAGLPVVTGQDPGAGSRGNVLPPGAAMALRVSTRVTGIDPAAKVVLAETTAPVAMPLSSTRDGARPRPQAGSGALADTGAGAVEQIAYDVLVLATGSRPAIPPLPGIRSVSSCLAADVAVLHSLGDARRIAAFAQAARRTGGRVAVLGGGVLGLEASRALAARGTAVTVVHRGAHLMDRQLDPAAGRVLADAMRRTGVEVSLGAGAARWEPGRGLWLADGRLVRASALVLCTGTGPGNELAAAAGLRLTEGGAVAVDDTLATSGPDIYAIGDCAGHPGAAGGLVQPGWEQAAVLAARLTGASPKARYRGSGAVTRLKAAGIELTAVGPLGTDGAPDGSGPGEELEVLRFEDPARERYAKLVLSGNRVAGAVLIGLPDAAAAIIQLYDRDAPAPADRLALLLGRALPPEAGGGTGPASLPDYAVVCRCNMVTKGQLRDAWYAGACGRDALSAATRAATGCGTCGDDVGAVAAWLAETDPSQPGARDCASGSRTGPAAGQPGRPGGGQPVDPQQAGHQEADPQQKEAALR